MKLGGKRLLGLLLAVIMAWGLAVPAMAVNPLLPLDEFIPDVEARVFTNAEGEERLYLYGSHDNYPPTSWCSHQYRVYSAPLDDLDNWTDHGVSFASRKGEGYIWNGEDADGIAWTDQELYAPDVLYFEGKYWLVSCLSGGGLAMSVSDTPEGPFSPATQICYDDEDKTPLPSIDPALYGEDGVLYVIWGQLWSEGLVGVELAKDENGIYSIAKSETKSELFGSKEASDNEFGFYEGPSIRKIGDKYYVLYPSNKGKGVHTMSYAIADHPLGPYTFMGNILENDGCDLEGGNNHGSLCEVNGQWYIFYHRGFNGNYSRKVCVEPITINPDGTIDPVVMTNHGFGGPLSPYEPVEAAYVTHVRLDGFTASCHLDEYGPNLHPLVNIKDGNCVEYRDFDFGSDGSPLRFSAEMLVQGGGEAELVLDDPNGQAIGTLRIEPSTDSDWTTVSAITEPVTGVHTLYLRFHADHSSSICEMARFQFAQLEAQFTEDFSGTLEQWDGAEQAALQDGALVVTGPAAPSVKNAQDWEDYYWQTDVTLEQGAAGLAFRRADAKNYYLLTTEETAMTLSVVANGTARELATAPVALEAGTPHKVTVECAGDVISVAVDGVSALRVQDSTLAAGGIGFVQEEGTTAVFDNLMVVQTQATRRDSITINGAPLTGFRNDVHSYEFRVREDDPIPVVGATSTDSNVTVETVQASSIPGTATVTFGAGEEAQVYTIRFFTEVRTQSDLFDGDAPGEFWKVVNPNPDNVYYEKGTGLTITTEPGDFGSSPAVKNMYLQPVDGDWSFETAISVNPSNYSGYSQAGVTVYAGDQNYMKFVYMNGVLEGKNNANQFLYQSGITLNGDLYIRVEKTGDQYVFSYSLNGTDYTVLPAQTFQGDQIMVGLAACSSNAGGQSIEATYRYFKFTDKALQTDLFDQAQYGSFWTVDNPDPSQVQYEPGVGVTIKSVVGDISASSNPTNTFLQKASGDWTVETALTANPAFGTAGADWPSAGLVARSGEQYIKLVYLNGGVELNTSSGEKEQLPLSLTDSQQVLKLRLSKKGTEYTASYSTDGGNTWLGFSATRSMQGDDVQTGFYACGFNGTVLPAVTFQYFKAESDAQYLPPAVPVESIELSDEGATIESGAIGMVEAKVLPDDASVKDVVWTLTQGEQTVELLSGRDSSVMLFRGLQPGTATLEVASAYDPSIVKTFEIQVTESAKENAVVSFAGTQNAVMGENAAYTMSVGNVERMATMTIWFEVDDAYFSTATAAIAGLNGFELLGNIEWTAGEGTKWTGRATLWYVGDSGANSVTITEAKELVQLQLTAKEQLGDTAVTLTNVLLSGYDEHGQEQYFAWVFQDGQNSVAVNVGEAYSIYDINRDGVVDQLDITTAQRYYAISNSDADWENAQHCDFNGDGTVGVDDLIVILNNITW